MKLVVFLLASIFVAVLVLSCTRVNPIPGSSACPSYHSSTVFYADKAFTADERAGIDTAAADWLAFSGGKIHDVIMFEDPPFEGARIRRVLSTDQVVKDENTKEATARGLPSFTSLGWSAKGPPRTVYLVVDLVPTDQIAHLLEHELGHAAGLRWPGCVEDALQLCDHSPDPTALMFAAFKNSPLGPADLEFCRASCLCN